MKDLESDIVELETLCSSTRNQGYFEFLNSKKMTLASQLDSEVPWALVGSWVQTIREMDAPSG